jgi:hypothetical protein
MRDKIKIIKLNKNLIVSLIKKIISFLIKE